MATQAENETAYGRTPMGQFLYDLAFTSLDERYLARKHGRPIAEVRRLRANPEIRKLKRKVKEDRRETRRKQGGA